MPCIFFFWVCPSLSARYWYLTRPGPPPWLVCHWPNGWPPVLLASPSCSRTHALSLSLSLWSLISLHCPLPFLSFLLLFSSNLVPGRARGAVFFFHRQPSRSLPSLFRLFNRSASSSFVYSDYSHSLTTPPTLRYSSAPRHSFNDISKPASRHWTSLFLRIIRRTTCQDASLSKYAAVLASVSHKHRSWWHLQLSPNEERNDSCFLYRLEFQPRLDPRKCTLESCSSPILPLSCQDT